MKRFKIKTKDILHRKIYEFCKLDTTDSINKHKLVDECLILCNSSKDECLLYYCVSEFFNRGLNKGFSVLTDINLLLKIANHSYQTNKYISLYKSDKYFRETISNTLKTNNLFNSLSLKYKKLILD